MIESDVNSLNSPNTGLLLVHLFKRPRAHTCDTLIPNNKNMAGRAKKEAAPDTKAEITKGQATGKAPTPKTDLKKCKELYEVVQTRGCKGATLTTVEECVDYVAEYMNFCERNPFIT